MSLGGSWLRETVTRSSPGQTPTSLPRQEENLERAGGARLRLEGLAMARERERLDVQFFQPHLRKQLDGARVGVRVDE